MDSAHHPLLALKVFSFAPIAIVALLACFRLSQAQGVDSYKLYEILAFPNGTLEIDDGFGNRTLKAEIVELNDCGDWVLYPTGTETPVCNNESLGSGLTTLSMSGIPSDGRTDGSDGSCRINNSTTGGKASYWLPIRAIKVTALYGWKFQPSSIHVSDVDMEGDTTVESSLRKAALVWGFSDGQLLNATWNLKDSALIRHNMKIESSTLSSLNLTQGPGMHAWLTGVMTTYGDRDSQPPYLRCNRGMAEPECAATASFDAPVDGFYVMANLEWKSTTQGNALISVGDLQMKKGCRCNTGSRVRQVTVLTGNPGECTRRLSSGPSSRCAKWGRHWCERRRFTRWVVSGPLNTATGAYPCFDQPRKSAKFVHMNGGQTLVQACVADLGDQVRTCFQPIVPPNYVPTANETQCVATTCLDVSFDFSVRFSMDCENVCDIIFWSPLQTLARLGCKALCQ